jgi:hypothetical protein
LLVTITIVTTTRPWISTIATHDDLQASIANFTDLQLLIAIHAGLGVTTMASTVSHALSMGSISANYNPLRLSTMVLTKNHATVKASTKHRSHRIKIVAILHFMGSMQQFHTANRAPLIRGGRITKKQLARKLMTPSYGSRTNSHVPATST